MCRQISSQSRHFLLDRMYDFGLYYRMYDFVHPVLLFMYREKNPVDSFCMSGVYDTQFWLYDVRLWFYDIRFLYDPGVGEL